MEPEEFICPITQAIMVDPVLGSDGRTYEHSAITEWLRTHTTSPITREPMTAASLTPNYALRSMIERHNTSVTIPKAKKPAKTAITAKSTNSVSEDHHYAIRVQQEEIAAYKPLNDTNQERQQTQQTQQNAEKQKKILTALCLIGLFIVILVIIIKIS